jgi:ectoine hydroxylase
MEECRTPEIDQTLISVDSSDLEAYRTNGFVLRRQLFDAEVAAEAVAWLQAQDQMALAKSWTEQEPGVPLAVYSVVHHDVNPFAKLVTDARILDVANQLVGKPTYLWASKVNMKAAWCGTAEYYHQDRVYMKDRGYPSEEMLSCMIFLERHSISNAALHVFPGTHRLGFIPHLPFININGLSKQMIPPPMLHNLYKRHGLVVIDAEPGDALFFHSSLVHGSSHNISPDGRMVLLAQLNTIGNEPQEVSTRAKLFNLSRAKMEYDEACRRHRHFKEKYQAQETSDELVFGPPIPNHEL